MMKKLFVTVFVLIAGISFSNAQLPCESGNYELDGNANDLSGNGYHGTNYGAVPTLGHTGLPNTAYAFNGGSSYIDLGSDFDYQQRTISLWFKAYNTPVVNDWAVIFAIDHATLNYGMIRFNNSNNGGTHCLNYGVGSAKVINRTIVNDTWYNAAIVVNLNYVKFYLNGVLQDSLTNNDFGHSASGVNVARLGCSRINQHYFYGAVDHLEIFNCAYTDAQINSIYLAVAENELHEAGVAVYPSPATDNLNIDITDANAYKNAIAEIYNLNGKLVYSGIITDQQSTLNIESLAKGLYVLKITGAEMQLEKKFVKE